MKALLQRVSEASVTVDGTVTGAIGAGLLVLVCADPSDNEETLQFLTRKIAAMRIFRDGDGKMNLSVKDTGGAVLAVSQFTLAADWRRGNRPGFSRAAGPELGEALYNRFCELLRAEGLTVETGRFGAEMEVRLLNDGPVTIWMDTNEQGT
jgi:D-tyrosyl-tRNA(Tyr) deacylase